MTVTSVWVGRTSASSARVRTKVTGSSVRLAVDTSASLANPVFFGPVTPTAEGMATLDATGLDAGTQYHYAVEEDDVLDTEFPGRFRTHPPLDQAASFVFAAAGDAGLDPDFPGEGAVVESTRISNAPVFDTIRSHDPLFFCHLGDMHYYNPGGETLNIIGSDVDDYRRCWDDVLLQSRQHQLYREIPLVYIWDDHDYGPNDSDGTFPDKTNAQQVYREKLPHYPLAESAAIYHSFQVGRVLFICADDRSYRSPDAEPDGPNKTMLGSAQKLWMRDLLESSDAQALVWVQQQQWIRGPWDSYATERDELAQMFIDLGWADRMVSIMADTHSMAMDSGANNNWGGFPVYLLASMDASPSSVPSGAYDQGVSNARDQYGLISVADGGSQITITADGYQGSTVLMSHTLIIDTEPEPEEPEPQPTIAPVTQAQIRTRMTWLGCDLVTGRRIAELHDITGHVSRLIGAHTSANLTIPIPLETTGRAPLQTVLQATDPARTMIVAVVNDLPLWAGVPLPRERGTEADMPLGCVTIEGYLDRRYVGDHDLVDVDEATIAATLVGDANVEGIGIIVDAPPTGTLRERHYRDYDDVTVYQRLQELSQVQNGPEWTIDLDWADDTKRVVQKIFRVRKRLGTAADPPTAVFQTTSSSVFQSRGGSSEARYRFTEDRTDGRYANHVIAVGSGEGEDRVQSAPARDEAALAAGQPRWESRIRPSTSITSVPVLGDHAAAELARRENGANTWKITARWDAYPRYGVDWRLGDDIGWRLFGHGHPDGVVGQGRAIGVELDSQAGMLSPILLELGEV